MYVISFANPKGGSGKTTATMLVAEQIHRRGGRVAILDCDPNQNLSNWQQLRRDATLETPITVTSMRNEENFMDQVEEYRDKADFLLVDLEGTASNLMTYSISQSDIVIIPFEPSPMETRQAARAVKLVKSTERMINSKIPHALLFNRVNAAFQSNDERSVREEIKKASIPVLSTPVVRRSAYTRIFREGLFLGELLDKSKGQPSSIEKAINNADRVCQDVVDILSIREAT